MQQLKDLVMGPFASVLVRPDLLCWNGSWDFTLDGSLNLVWWSLIDSNYVTSKPNEMSGTGKTTYCSDDKQAFKRLTENESNNKKLHF